MDNLSYAAYLATFLPLLVSIVNPAVASFFSRSHWPELATQSITVALSAVEAFVAQLIEGGNFSITKATAIALGSYVLSALARSQFWKNTRVDAKLLAFPNKLDSAVAGDVTVVNASELVKPTGEDEIVVDASSLLGPSPTSAPPRPSPTPKHETSLPPTL